MCVLMFGVPVLLLGINMVFFAKYSYKQLRHPDRFVFLTAHLQWGRWKQHTQQQQQQQHEADKDEACTERQEQEKEQKQVQEAAGA